MNGVEAALNAWSVNVQLSVAAIMTIVFSSVWRRSLRSYLRSWSIAWALDLVAIVVILFVLSVSGMLPSRIELFLYLIYATTKIGFAAMLLLGLEQFHRSKVAMAEGMSFRISVILAVLGLVVLISNPPVLAIQTVVYFVVGLIIVAAGFSSLISPRSGESRLLAGVFFLHSGLFFHHGLILSSHLFGSRSLNRMSWTSFLDAGVELLVGMVLLMAVGNSAVDEMERINENLEAAQRWLRELVDADPLTGLYNRRRLRRFIADVGPAGGVLIYLDIDYFKKINDHWGHCVGDSCLKRIAERLRAVFRAEDGLFRMGGDEFLVVAPGLEFEEAQVRIETLRDRLLEKMEGQPALMISAGFAPFGEGYSWEEALASADHAMYKDKESRRR